MKYKKNIGDLVLSVTRTAYRKADGKLNPSFARPSEYEFENRQKGSEHLLIVLAGYQPYYFDAVFERVRKNEILFGEEIDICVCDSNGSMESKQTLRDLCSRYGWSFLYLKKNRVTQVQNTAIKLHPNAGWIYKMDEDIILCDNYFSLMKKAYLKADDELPYKVGFLGPVLNINAFGTQVFLKKIGKWDEFQQKFGRFRVGGMINTTKDLIHRDPEWAKYIWEYSVPFDEVAFKMAQTAEIEICSIRFSIGAILIRRDFFEYNGWLPVFRNGGMGTDEKFLCDVCIEGMYSIPVATNVFVGHLGFGPQKDTCKNFFEKNEQLVRIG